MSLIWQTVRSRTIFLIYNLLVVVIFYLHFKHKQTSNAVLKIPKKYNISEIIIKLYLLYYKATSEVIKIQFKKYKIKYKI